MDIHTFLDPATTALLVIDKQYGYLAPDFVALRHKSMPSNAEQVVEDIEKMILAARNAGVEVVWTQMVEDESLSPAPISELIKHDVLNIGTITKPGEKSFDFYGAITPLPTEKVITKMRYDAFSQTDLAKYLKSKNITSVVLVGGYATRCILSTCVGANGEDFFCIIPEGLVINQKESDSEVPVLYSIVNAIFGKTVEPGTILEHWRKLKN